MKGLHYFYFMKGQRKAFDPFEKMDWESSEKLGLDSLELIIKDAEAKTAKLRLKREKLFHKKIMEIAGYDNKGSI